MDTTLSKLQKAALFRSYFFRKQAVITFYKLLESVKKDYNTVFDGAENLFYTKSIKDLIKLFGLTPKN